MKTYNIRALTNTPLPASTAIVSVLFGDGTAVGHGSVATGGELRTDTVGEPGGVTDAYVFNKWTGTTAARYTAADAAAGITQIDDGMGETAGTDLGPEYSLGSRMARRYAGRCVGGANPDAVIIKFGVAAGTVSVEEGTVLNGFHPALAASANTVLTTHYISPALTYLAANYDEVVIEGIYCSIGLTDAAAGGGAGESFAADLLAVLKSVQAAVGIGHVPVVAAAPPLVSRATSADIDLVRNGYSLAQESGAITRLIDGDLFERGGGATPPLHSSLNAQGTHDLGLAFADAMHGYGGAATKLWSTIA